MIDDRHAESGAAPRDGLADAAHAENAERAAMHLGAEQKIVRGTAPVASTHVALALADAPRGSQQQRPGEIGNRLVQHVGRIRRDDAGGGQCGEIEIVVADGDVGHGPQFRRLCDRCGIQWVGDSQDGTVSVTHLARDLRLRPGTILSFDFDVEEFAQPVDDVGEQRTRDPDART